MLAAAFASVNAVAVSASINAVVFSASVNAVVVSASVGDSVGACTTASDCSLNGDCVDGKCVCDAAWSASPICDVMAFEPLDKKSMPGYYNKTESSWGGFPIATGDGDFHLLHTQIANSCPLQAWSTTSTVALSKSVTGKVEGPYEYQRAILPAFATNPTIRKAADGTFVIYYIGGWPTPMKNCTDEDEISASFLHEEGRTMQSSWTATSSDTNDTNCTGRMWPKTCGKNMPGPAHDCCGPANASYTGNGGCGLSVAWSKSLQGPWETAPLSIEDQWLSDELYCAHTNPSPVFLSNGTVLMAFNAGFCNNHLETIGLAVADHWKGPYRLFEKNAILRNPDGTPHKCEDPYLYQSKRGWHLIAHNQQGPQGESSYGYSVDGHTWTLSPNTPNNCTLHYTDGTSGLASGCGNRPQIVWSGEGGALDRGGLPQWMVNGAFAEKPEGGNGTWTLFRKLKQ